MKSNELTIDYRDNPDLKDVLQDKSPGDEVCVELELEVIANDSDTFVARIKGVYADNGSEDNVGEGGAPDAEHPVMIVMMGRKRNLDKSKAKDAEADDDDSEDGTDAGE